MDIAAPMCSARRRGGRRAGGSPRDRVGGGRVGLRARRTPSLEEGTARRRWWFPGGRGRRWHGRHGRRPADRVRAQRHGRVRGLRRGPGGSGGSGGPAGSGFRRVRRVRRVRRLRGGRLRPVDVRRPGGAWAPCSASCSGCSPPVATAPSTGSWRTTRARQAVAGEDPSPSWGERSAVEQAGRLAELWLDPVTALAADGPLVRGVVPGPVGRGDPADLAHLVTPGGGEDVREHGRRAPPGGGPTGAAATRPRPRRWRGLLANAGPMMQRLGGGMLGMQIGQAVGRLATEAVSATDIGLPLHCGGMALVPANVAALSQGLGVRARRGPAVPAPARGRPRPAVRPRAVAGARGCSVRSRPTRPASTSTREPDPGAARRHRPQPTPRRCRRRWARACCSRPRPHPARGQVAAGGPARAGRGLGRHRGRRRPPPAGCPRWSSCARPSDGAVRRAVRPSRPSPRWSAWSCGRAGCARRRPGGPPGATTSRSATQAWDHPDLLPDLDDVDATPSGGSRRWRPGASRPRPSRWTTSSAGSSTAPTRPTDRRERRHRRGRPGPTAAARRPGRAAPGLSQGTAPRGSPAAGPPRPQSTCPSVPLVRPRDRPAPGKRCRSPRGTPGPLGRG